jgi:hypothetical protein
LITLSGAYDLLVTGGAIAHPSGFATFSSLFVGSNSLLTHVTGQTSLSLTISRDAIIEAGGAITANGKGFAGGIGPGAGGSFSTSFGFTGGGGGYGGYGGANFTNLGGGNYYGSVLSPTDFGSGGGQGAGTFPNSRGGAGGGAIRLTVNGMLLLNGTLGADGGNGIAQGSGGGSGGSVWLTLGRLSGNGRISANGGSGEMPLGGGGAGGRIATYYGTNQFSGAISAYGGAGVNVGAAGTVYTAPGNTFPQLAIDNGGVRGTNTPIPFTGVTFDLLISGGGAVDTGPSSGSSLGIHNLQIRSNGWVTTTSVGRQINLFISGSAIVLSGGGFLLDGAGFGSAQGSGPGQTGNSPFVSGGGGGHGGYGGASGFGASGGNSYDSLITPMQAGSGGGNGTGSGTNNLGGAGGGALQLTVAGGFTFQGIISANGKPGVGQWSGGGSGGSVYITAGNFEGQGTISVNGGAGDPINGGGGGGGRIAINYTSRNFSGSVAARGGCGANYGGAGTVYWKAAQSPYAQVIIDNGGFPGTNTPLSLSTLSDLTISGGAAIYATTLPPLGSLLIASNSWLSFTSPFSPRTITVNSNVTVQSGGGITLDGQGSNQQGGGSFGSGGGYGGYGGNSATNRGGGNSYGSISAPVDLGSTGGGPISQNGGAGGGALHLIVGGSLALDGSITARGATSQITGSGGGSGGSLWISTSKLSGSGLISADGASGDLPMGGGGGGGRVALYFSTNQFTGIISAHGGAGANYGGAGTMYLAASNTFNPGIGIPYPTVVIDNGNARGTNTPLSLSGGQFDLRISGGGSASVTTIPTIGTLLIASNSFLSYTSPFTPRTMTVISNATIQGGGGIVLDGQGSGGGSGTGPGQTAGISGGGGGHGGFGGSSSSNAAGGIVYGSITAPVTLGSGGGGSAFDTSGVRGAGGGALHLIVNGTLALDGIITVNGTTGTSQASGGGSGGSLWVTVGKLTGGGILSANGGAGDLPAGGGGGGGRIAITFNTNQFTGNILARGGQGAMYGGAGTIYVSANKGFPTLASLIVDNGGGRGANTPLSFFDVIDFDLSLGSGAGVVLSNTVSFRNLLIGSNSFLISPRATITVRSNATIQSSGAIVLDGLGSSGGQGIGAGRSTTVTSYGTTGGGGGYAGYGGSSAFGSAGGTSYGSISGPTDSGSGGGSGNGTSTNNLGGSGGGALQLTVSGTLSCDGKISADGLVGIGHWSGGGSGGSIWLTVGKLTGGGIISANGGAGDSPYGGGGGGGRIAISFSTNQFTGGTFARGGIGATAGGAGTIYLRTNNNNSSAQVTIDNGGPRGTNTPLTLTGSFNLTVGAGAIVNPAVGTTVANLLINSNGWLSQLPNPGNVSLTVSGVATIRGGGGIIMIANGLPLPGSSAPGAGGTINTPADAYTGGGGGYGGYGAQSVDGASGGNSYGSLTQPTDPGSGGGGYLAPTLGALGGGSIRLNVLGSLLLDGQISADGGDAAFEGEGGGSGGSVWLTVGTLTGTGVISADGGNGDFFQGGGGGGGRLAIYYGANLFLGSVSAYGGGGAFFGGAGTVYTKANTNTTARIVIDNGGEVGTNTPLPSLSTPDLLIIGGAIANPSVPLVLNSLVVDSLASLTHSPQSKLDLIVLGTANIGTNGSVVVNGKGYAGVNAAGPDGGPGAGQMPPGNAGSGGGYGGVGGASASGVPGGATYGSALQPTDLGSSGGYDLSGAGYASLSQGGGAVRMRVGGVLTVNGKITANGNDGTYDRSGGGSGGSIWLSARTFDGHGFITANGGAGELFDGGGGGGGRIAIYSRTNNFSGPVAAFGGYGNVFGGSGTVLFTNIPAPQVIAQVPFAVVSYTVSNVDISFGTPMNPASASPADIIIYTPNGSLPESSITVTALDLSRFRFSFPAQSTVGYYEIDAGPNIEDFYGVSMSDVYIGSFVISSPTISGRVTATNGLPVSFVTLRAGTGLLPVVTDANGQYALEVPPGWIGTITPSKGSALFIPASRSYVNVSTDLTNQNFISASSGALTLHSQKQGPNLSLNWFGINGVTYQTLYSTNLVDWLPYGDVVMGTNGPINVLIPTGNDPADFFRFSTSY